MPHPGELRLAPCRVGWKSVTALLVAAAWVLPACVVAKDGEQRYDALIARVVRETGGPYEVPFALVKAVIRQESAFRSDAVSRAGARGLMQVMPSTAARLGVAPERLFDPEENIRAGVRLLASLLERYQGDVITTVAAYNAGPLPALAPLPRNAEAPAYVWRVLGFYEAYSGPTVVHGADESAPGREWPFLQSRSLGARALR